MEPRRKPPCVRHRAPAIALAVLLATIMTFSLMSFCAAPGRTLADEAAGADVPTEARQAGAGEAAEGGEDPTSGGESRDGTTDGAEAPTGQDDPTADGTGADEGARPIPDEAGQEPCDPAAEPSAPGGVDAAPMSSARPASPDDAGPAWVELGYVDAYTTLVAAGGFTGDAEVTVELARGIGWREDLLVQSLGAAYLGYEVTDDATLIRFSVSPEVTVTARGFSLGGVQRATLDVGGTDRAEADLELAAAAVPQLMAAWEDGTVDYVNGHRIYYGGTFTTLKSTGDGQLAYCVQPTERSPQSGTYTVRPLETEVGNANLRNLLRSAMWYAPGGPGYDRAMWPARDCYGNEVDEDIIYALCHIVMSYIYAADAGAAVADVTDATYRNWALQVTIGDGWEGKPPVYGHDEGWNGKTALYGPIVQGLLAGEVPDHYQVFLINTGAISQTLVASYDWAALAIGKTTDQETLLRVERGELSLTGAVYGIYADAACTQLVCTASPSKETDLGLVTTVRGLTPGEYWIREVSAPEGFALSDEVRPVTLGHKECGGAWMSDSPEDTGFLLQVRKSSSCPGATQGNEAYDLAGAVYGIYTLEEGEYVPFEVDGEKVTLTTGADGVSGQVRLEPGTYYVREIEAPRGFVPCGEYHLVDAGSAHPGELRTVDCQEDYLNDPVALVIRKVDAESGEAVPQGSASLEGARFRLDFYGGYPDVDATDIAPLRSWVIQTRASGFASLGDVVGDEGPFTTANGTPTLPLGTLVITEVGAPVGYALPAQGTRSVIRIIQREDGTIGPDTTPDASGALALWPEEVLRAGIMIDKVDDGSGSALGWDLSGARFAIINANEGDVWVGGTRFGPGEEVMCLITDADGHAQTGADALPLGTYAVRETTAPAGHLLDATEHVITLDQEGVIHAFDSAFMNEVIPARIGTNARDAANGTHLPQVSPVATIIDAIGYEGLNPDLEGGYVAHATLVDASDGSVLTDVGGNPIGASAEWVPASGSGTVEVSITLDARDLAGRSVVVFETVTNATGDVVASHEEVDDPDQTVTFIDLGTRARDASDGDQVLDAGLADATITDTVSWQGLEPGRAYELQGILLDAVTGEAVLDAQGGDYRVTVGFTPDQPSGETTVTFELGDISHLAGRTTVVSEALYRDGVLIAIHADLDDREQTVGVAALSTTAHDLGMTSGEANAQATTPMTYRVADTVAYSLPTGLAGNAPTLTLWGTLMDKATGEPFVDATGKVITATRTFTPDPSGKGSVQVDFTFDASPSSMEGRTLVCFETLLGGDGAVIATHDDIRSVTQSITYGTPFPQTGVGMLLPVLAVAACVTGAAIFVSATRTRRGPGDGRRG